MGTSSLALIALITVFGSQQLQWAVSSHASDLDAYAIAEIVEMLRQEAGSNVHRISGRSGAEPAQAELDASSGNRSSHSHSRSARDNSNCHSLPSEIHVTKEETDETGNVVRVCEGTVQVAKCEGTCHSELRPSVHSPNGFAKVICLFTFCLLLPSFLP